MRYNSYYEFLPWLLLVCQTAEEIHPGPEDKQFKSVDQPDEENNPDSRVSGSAVRTVEVSQ